jgi:hypothetical protein
MNIKILLIVGATFVASLVQADMGWTYEQCEAAWGKPFYHSTDDSRGPGNYHHHDEVFRFRRNIDNGIETIGVVIEDGKVTSENKSTEENSG